MSNCDEVTTIDLMRHGECEGGAIFRGSTDSPLTATGVVAMQQRLVAIAADKSLPLKAVVTSPLLRCSAQALIFSQRNKLELAIEPAFAEINFGDWEGRAVAEVASTEPEAIADFWRDPIAHTPPNGEDLLAFQQRVNGAWQLLLSRYRGQRVLLLSHGGVIRMLLANLLAMPLRPLSHLHVPHCGHSQIKIFHSGEKADWPQLIFLNRNG